MWLVSNAITYPFKRETRNTGAKAALMETEGMMWPRAKDCRLPPEAGRGQQGILPWSLWGSRGPMDSLISVIPISNFWPPGLWENEYLLHEASQLLAFCLGSTGNGYSVCAHAMLGADVKTLGVAYLKFKFRWATCILLGSHHNQSQRKGLLKSARKLGEPSGSGLCKHST